MNAKKFQMVLIVVVIALVASVVPVFAAYPTEMPGTNPQVVAAADCSALQAQAARIDIPSRRADYALLDKLSNCYAVSGVRTNVVPITGNADRVKERFLRFKMRQAEDNSH